MSICLLWIYIFMANLNVNNQNPDFILSPKRNRESTWYCQGNGYRTASWGVSRKVSSPFLLSLSLSLLWVFFYVLYLYWSFALSFASCCNTWIFTLRTRRRSVFFSAPSRFGQNYELAFTWIENTRHRLPMTPSSRAHGGHFVGCCFGNLCQAILAYIRSI